MSEKIVQFNEEIIKGQIKELVRGSVEGTQPYELEFEYWDGEVRGLVCNCFCSGVCKHEVAAMLQLRDILASTEKYYAAQYAESEYFAAVNNRLLFSLAVDAKESGSFTLRA